MKKYLVYPLIFALYPAIALWLENYDQVLFSDVLPTLPFILLFLMISWAVIYRLTGDRMKSAILVSAFMALTFAFGYLVFLMKILTNRDTSWNWVVWLVNTTAGLGVLLLIWVNLFLCFSFLVLKSRSRLQWLTNFLNVFSLVILAFLTLNLLSQVAGDQRKAVEFESSWKQRLGGEETLDTNLSSNPELPDIYYIILDGYGRQDILKELYGYDNSDFTDSLEAKGFYVADQSKTNYSQTIYSLSSSLNYQYLDELPQKLGETNQSLLAVRSMASDNRLFRQLQGAGYLIRSIPTGFLLTDHLEADQTSLPAQRLNAFQNQLVGATPIPVLLNLSGLPDQYDLHRRRLLFAFDELARRPQVEQPVFTFTHILAPHPPFVLDAQGNPIDHSGLFILKDGSQFVGSRQEYLQGYRDQATYISLLAGETIDEILSSSERPVIIILQGDHGPGLRFVWDSWKQTYLPERMSILNAYYFPDQDYSRLYPGITPVNTFRVILSQYFDQDLPLLEDRNYFTSLYKPYQFTDVTTSVTDAQD